MQEIYQRREQRVAKVLDSVGEEAQRAVYAAEYRKRYQEAFAPKTIENVAGSWRVFSRWCTEFSRDPTIPVSPITLADFVDYLGGKIAVTTIQNHLWAIGELHRAEFYPSPSRHRLVLLSLRGVKRKWGSAIRQAPPLCRHEVLAIVKTLGQRRLDIRNKALVLTASDSWCRASEIIAMKVKHLERQEDGSSVVTLAGSKNNPYGRGEFGYLSRLGTKAVADWVQLKGLESEDFIFTGARLTDGKEPIATATVSRIFKKLTGRKEISSHSTRIGGVHDALRLGCSLGSIMVAGRWASPEMPAVYGRKLFVSRSAAAEVAEAYDDGFD